jgi:hypothetical protein
MQRAWHCSLRVVLVCWPLLDQQPALPANIKQLPPLLGWGLLLMMLHRLWGAQAVCWWG